MISWERRAGTLAHSEAMIDLCLPSNRRLEDQEELLRPAKHV